MKFTWDKDKVAQNVEKHGVSFETAVLVFNDPNLLLRPDHFPDEERLQAIGFATLPALLLVVHTETYAEQDDSVIRLISARFADRRERATYWQALQRQARS